jgi:DNA-3-methyladenine glycosylase
MPTRPASLRGALRRPFYVRPTLRVAADLIGKVLVHDAPEGRCAGLIVEVEAYVGEDDPACHAASGPTARNAPLYGPPGQAYVYLNYGLHHLVNAVTEPAGSPAAVLIRALDPVVGLDLMRARRGVADGERHRLCRGPGNLSRALGITLANNRLDLTSGVLRVEDWAVRPGPVSWGPRIGIRVATDRPWRCWVTGHPAVSGPRQPAYALHLGRSPAPRVGRTRSQRRPS